MVKLAEKFVPVIVDGDVDKEVCGKFGVNGFPHTVFLDTKGKVAGQVGGAVSADRFLASMEAAVKKIGPVKLRKEAKDLEDAGKALEKARDKKDWKGTVKAVLAIEKINHEGAILEAARTAKKEASAEAGVRLDEAKRLDGAGKKEEARRILLKVSSDFEGLEEAAAAKALLKAMDAPPPDAGDGKPKEPEKGDGK